MRTGGDQELLLFRRESSSEPPNYFMRNLKSGADVALTDFAHPQPQLAQTQSSLISYKRADGIDLTAKLYLPAGYDPARDGPRPCLMWACEQPRPSAQLLPVSGSLRPLLKAGGFGICKPSLTKLAPMPQTRVSSRMRRRRGR